MQGHLSLVLHAHLPFVRHPEHPEFLEEDWLYEAITETYLPLLRAFDRLAGDGLKFRVTLTLSPTLVAMLDDDLLLRRYEKKLAGLVELAEREVLRTRKDATFAPLASYYLAHFLELQQLFVTRYRRDLVSAFAKLQAEGYLEIITCTATHGFLPLLRPSPEACRAQIKVAQAEHTRVFGRPARGIWLAECGYFPGVETWLAEENLRFFFVDAHAILDAGPRPRYSVYAPIFTEAGVAAFGRDPESSQQVWSSEAGYPGDPDYREFYRDIGFDLPVEALAGQLQATGARRNTGIKYHRITGKTDTKLPYDPMAAAERAAIHADHFVASRRRQIESLAPLFGSAPKRARAPIVVAPYDAELFGHWWFEGPLFLEFVIRKAVLDQNVFSLMSPFDYLTEYPSQQQATPALSSWGAKGYASMWLDPTNDWIYRHLHGCAERMVALATDFPSPPELLRRALNQAARELLLAQASDWAFILKTGTMVGYAKKRTEEHVLRFLKFEAQVRGGVVDEAFLANAEARNNLFPDLDYRVYRREA